MPATIPDYLILGDPLEWQPNAASPRKDEEQNEMEASSTEGIPEDVRALVERHPDERKTILEAYDALLEERQAFLKTIVVTNKESAMISWTFRSGPRCAGSSRRRPSPTGPAWTRMTTTARCTRCSAGSARRPPGTG